MTDQLVQLAIELARPSCCETVLLRFIERVKLEARSEQDVREMFLALRKPSTGKKARLVSEP